MDDEKVCCECEGSIGPYELWQEDVYERVWCLNCYDEMMDTINEKGKHEKANDDSGGVVGGVRNGGAGVGG